MRNEVAEGNVKAYCEDLEKRLEQMQEVQERLQGKLARNFDDARESESTLSDMKKQLEAYKDENARLKKQLESLQDN